MISPTSQEVIDYLKENLKLNVRSIYEYCYGGETSAEKTYTIELLLDGEVISKAELS